MASLAAHGGVPIAFRVERVLEVSAPAGGLGGLVLDERPVSEPWIKDYNEREAPSCWTERFDVSRWGLLSAWQDGARIGGAVVAHDTPGLDLLEGRSDLAHLFDLRVAPAFRRTGVGRLLFASAEAWARARGCAVLEVETQNINVPACRFYARMGCALRRIDRGAYPDYPLEVQLIWSRRLS